MSDEKSKSLLENIETISKIVSLFALPLIVAIGGWWIQNSISIQSVNKDYVTLAIGILQKPKGEVDQNLREWAVDILNTFAPKKLPKGTAKDLISGNISLNFLNNAIASKSSQEIAISPNGSNLAVIDAGNIKIYDLTTGSEVVDLISNSRVTAIAFSPDAKRLVAGNIDGTVKVWNVLDNTVYYRFDGKETVVSLVFSPDSSRFTFGTLDGEYKTVDINSGKVVSSIRVR